MTETIPIRSLSNSQQRKLQRSKSFDQLAEELVAEAYGLSTFNDAEWYDCVDEASRTKYEVKSTATKIGDKYPSDGRFRLWQGQHNSLTASQGQSMAWYAFVLLDQQNAEIAIQRRKPTTVTQLINDRGGWNQSGHKSKGKQHKVPYSTIF